MILVSNIKTLTTAAFLAISSFSSAQAATVSLSHDLEVEYQTQNGVRSNTSTYTTDIVGSIITANYADGSSEDLTWTRTSDWTAGVNSTGMTLGFDWWGFDLTATNRLASLSFDLAPSGSIFDAANTIEGLPGNTPTTLFGIPFYLMEYRNYQVADTTHTGHVTGAYSGLVQLVGHAPGVDAFTRLAIDFTGLNGGGLLGAVTLALDMDVLAGGADDLTPVAVPLPNSLLLLLAGLGAIGLLGTRTKADQRQSIAANA